jgi:hypothetical protein
MSHIPVGLDIEDMTPKQLRKALSHYARISLPKGKRKEPEEEDEDTDENDDLVNLHEEKKGDSKPPKVTKADLPKGFALDDEEEEEETDSKKKGKS